MLNFKVLVLSRIAAECF